MRSTLHRNCTSYQYDSGIKEGDAVLLTSSYSIEGETLDTVKSWFKEWNQEVCVLGPLFPTGYGVVQESDWGSYETREFLDKALLEHGEKSLTLVSSIFNTFNI